MHESEAFRNVFEVKGNKSKVDDAADYFKNNNTLFAGEIYYEAYSEMLLRPNNKYEKADEIKRFTRFSYSIITAL